MCKDLQEFADVESRRAYLAIQRGLEAFNSHGDVGALEQSEVVAQRCLKAHSSVVRDHKVLGVVAQVINLHAEVVHDVKRGGLCGMARLCQANKVLDLIAERHRNIDPVVIERAKFYPGSCAMPHCPINPHAPLATSEAEIQKNHYTPHSTAS